MSDKFDVSDAEVSLPYGLAEIAFGEKALNQALGRSPWRERFPNLAELTLSYVAPNGTILPGELLYEVVGSDDREYDFYTNPERTRVYSLLHSAVPVTAEEWSRIEIPKDASAAVRRLGEQARRLEPIPAQEALLVFGAYAL